ncbi:hypothetical protein HPB47_004236 [Ixodes persulcatus]|uniref:Uncharacterized protein n=1 Tax=Ixodes persulcatus TaxID=34615 RepID=A0AC60PGA3_IXOPE|nr:hypothetical protein HPB47_004236 [Ixodes persulcatus]
MQNCDLLCLQETNFARFRDVADFEARFSVTAFFSYAPRRATGVGVVVCNRSRLRNATYLFDTEGRTVRFDFFFGERKFRLVTVYAPTVSTFQHDYFRSLDVHLLDAGPCFLVGDFNCVLDSNADVRGPGQGRSTWSARELRRLVRHFDLVDGWSLLHGSTHQSTWNRGASGSRIDRLYLPRTLSAALQTCTAVDFPSCPEEISDHRPLLIKFCFDSAVVRSSRPWHLDSRILRDETTRRTLGNMVKESLVGAQGSPSVHPEVLRYTHRTSLQAFERQQTPSASGSPGRLDNGRFAAHFRSLAQSDAPVDRNSVSSHPLLSGLPKISAEDDAGLRRPPSATELWNLRVSAYADDVTLYLRDEDSLVKALRLFDEYACLSGAWLNPGKSKSLCIGAPPTCPPSLPRAQSVIILGVSYDASGVAPETWAILHQEIIEKAAEAGHYDFPMAVRRYLVVACGPRSPPAAPLHPPSALGAVYLLLEQPHRTRGWSFPCIELAAPILTLKTTLAILDDHDNPARPLTLYFLGANNRLLGDSLPSPLRPRAETTSAFYKSTADLFDKLSVHVTREEILEAPASRLVERQVAADQPPPPPGAVQPNPLLALTSSTLPDHVRDFEWLKGWGVLPTKDRLFRWGVVRDAQCVNCGAIETNAHVVRDCVPARDLWRIIQRSFRDLGVDVYVTRGRCPRGAFALLLVAVCEWVLWRNRCAATAQRQRRRALWPLLWDIRKELTAYLDDQQFSLGEQEFLRRARFPGFHLVRGLLSAVPGYVSSSSPSRAPTAMATASTQDSPPPKAHAFDVVVPVGTSADDLIDGVSAIVGLPEIFSAQHLGGTNFQVVVNTRAAALKLREAGSVSIANQSVPIASTGSQVTNVTCLFLPTFVRNDQLVQALAPYGKVIDVSYVTYHRTATVKTGTRFIRMEMKEANPLPNFLRVAGHRRRATFGYSVRRCYCDRCGVFGHPTEDCTANCRRCGGTHATVDCTAKRGYSSMVAGNYATDFQALDRGNSTSPIGPEAPAVPPVSTVDPPSPPDAVAAATSPPPPSAPPSAPPEPEPDRLGGDFRRGDGLCPSRRCCCRRHRLCSLEPRVGLLRNATYLFDTEGRTVRFDFFFGERKFRIVTIYAPTVSTFQHDYFRSLDVHLLDAGPCFLVDDFNCVLDSNADVRGPGQGRSTWSTRELRRLVRHFDLLDGWSLLHRSTQQSTWNRGASGSRIDRLYLPRTLSAALQTCTAVDFPSCPEEISDHRPLLIKFCFNFAVVRSSRRWRLDSRILHDETTRRTLGNLVKESLVGVRPEPASWDRLKVQWQSFSTLMGRHLRERHRGLLQDTILRNRIVRRGGALTPFMRAYLDQLQRRYERYLRLDSTVATVLQAQGSPSVHPEILRYTHRTGLQAFESQQTPSASGSPGRRDNGRFAAHFRSLAQSDAPVDRNSVPSHPLLSGLPKISAEDDAGLRRPPRPSISGLALAGSGEIRVSAYADDVTLYLRDEDSLVKALRLFDEYACLSGAWLNPGKSKSLCIGAPPTCPSSLPRAQSVTILGVSYDASGVAPETWAILHQEIIQKAAEAGHYDFPMAVRRYLVQTVFCGRLWDVARVALPPRPFILQVRSALFTFFWNNRTELVRRSRLCLPRGEGGWSFPCIELAAPILTLKTTLAILDDHDNPPRPLTLYFLGTSNRLFGDSLPSPLRPRAETTPAFYKSTADLFDKLSAHVS